MRDCSGHKLINRDTCADCLRHTEIMGSRIPQVVKDPKFKTHACNDFLFDESVVEQYMRDLPF